MRAFGMHGKPYCDCCGDAEKGTRTRENRIWRADVASDVPLGCEPDLCEEDGHYWESTQSPGYMGLYCIWCGAKRD